MAAALRNNDGSKLHPAVPDLADAAGAGRLGCRDFLRTAALLGVSVASAQVFLGPAHGVARAQEPAPRAGGTLRFASQIQEITDPALLTWTSASNLVRNCLEFLTLVDADNVTHPYLARAWSPSYDLKTWTFTLQEGVRWSNGDAFTADDVGFNIERWTASGSKSSNRTAFAVIESFEKLDDLHFRLHLRRPVLALPEMLYAYTCAIVHRGFDPAKAPWPKSPVGTGPYEMVEYAVGRRARFRRRDGYWGEPGLLDEIVYIDLGTDVSAHVAALAAGQVDVLYRITVAELDLIARLPNVQLLREKSAQTICMRMQTDQPPYDDVRVRRAVVLAADNQRMLDLAYRGQGSVAENHHVAPFQPDYAALPRQRRDVERAKSLLAEAGHGSGIDMRLVLGNTQGRWEQGAAQVLQQNLAEAGIRLQLDVLPTEQYWPIWSKVPFGLTYWVHRPLGVMSLDLAYRSTAAWNESHFKDPGFDAALDAAMGTIDPGERATAMAMAEKSLQDAAVMVQPFWGDRLTAASSRVRGFRVHPSDYFKMDGVWLA